MNGRRIELDNKKQIGAGLGYILIGVIMCCAFISVGPLNTRDEKIMCVFLVTMIVLIGLFFVIDGATCKLYINWDDTIEYHSFFKKRKFHYTDIERIERGFSLYKNAKLWEITLWDYEGNILAQFDGKMRNVESFEMWIKAKEIPFIELGKDLEAIRRKELFRNRNIGKTFFYQNENSVKRIKIALNVWGYGGALIAFFLRESMWNACVIFLAYLMIGYILFLLFHRVISLAGMPLSIMDEVEEKEKWKKERVNMPLIPICLFACCMWMLGNELIKIRGNFWLLFMCVVVISGLVYFLVARKDSDANHIVIICFILILGAIAVKPINYVFGGEESHRTEWGITEYYYQNGEETGKTNTLVIRLNDGEIVELPVANRELVEYTRKGKVLLVRWESWFGFEYVGEYEAYKDYFD